MDYQKSYLEEKIHSCNMEMQVIQMRFQILQAELVKAQEELVEYNKTKGKHDSSK
jgi:hypothetical protein